jgi:RNA 2',3'-cyclic 3'-phosphodiesterase
MSTAYFAVVLRTDKGHYRCRMPGQFSQTGSDPAAKITDRLFFAIFPEAAAAARIARLARQLRGEHGLKGKPLETQRLHVTLHHLGDYAGLPRDIVAASVEAAATVAMSPFEVSFDRALSFPDRPANRPFVLRGGDGVGALGALQRTLGAALGRAGLAAGRAEPPYTPHVTLLYDDSLVAERPVETVAWTVCEFVLVHSLLGRKLYVPLARWPLAT